jgi:prepilin-type N-terminal cleavage/methylation domain-containing protein
MHNMKKNTQNAGFSLIEVAIVIVIGGILISLFGDSLVNLVTNSKFKTTQVRLKEVDEAVKRYASVNNRLPCVASLSTPVETATYGRETVCQDAPEAGTFHDATYNVRIGGVPTRTLNLPDSHAYDGWGSRFVYSVTAPLTDRATYNLKNGRIDVVDSNNHSMVTPQRSITYLLLSVGPDRNGGYNPQGHLISTCAGASALDGENCDNDATFRNTLMYSTSNNNSRFDDHVMYEGNFESAYVPSGAIMAFESTTCPNGWAPLTALVGRTIIGAGQYTQDSTPPGLDAADYKGETFNLSAKGGHATIMGPEDMGAQAQYKSLPPYVAYLYCRKN